MKMQANSVGSPRRDLNVEPVWMQGLNGSSVVVGIVDDGEEKEEHVVFSLKTTQTFNFSDNSNWELNMYF